ncbi:nuclear transport factor 2 family protein [Flavobacterium rhizosphaerae]|uniref:Nuclear transport factor 2 family protein n=1 Tax=Flavobacterium rhizosphaerae TaxID=3163298 RepID=A0ABW8Z2G1_9FLAO
METKQHIADLENRLTEAMKTGNVAALDVLLADTMLFTNHNGHLVTKQDELDAHNKGNIEIFEIKISAQLIEVYGDMGIVSVIKDISGNYNGHTNVGVYRYTRVWQQTGDNWQVVAGHCSKVLV